MNEVLNQKDYRMGNPITDMNINSFYKADVLTEGSKSIFSFPLKEENSAGAFTKTQWEEQKGINDSISSEIASTLESEEYSKYRPFQPSFNEENETHYTNDYLFEATVHNDLDKSKLNEDINSLETSSLSYDDLFLNNNGTTEDYIQSTETQEFMPSEEIENPNQTLEFFDEKKASDKNQEIHEISSESTHSEDVSINSPKAEESQPMKLLSFHKPGTIVVTTSIPSSTQIQNKSPTYSPSDYQSPVKIKKSVIPSHEFSYEVNHDPGDKSRTIRRKERNRIAAKRCRQRKAEYVRDLEHQVEVFQAQVSQLQNEIKHIQKEHSLPNKQRRRTDLMPTYDLRHKRIERSSI